MIENNRDQEFDDLVDNLKAKREEFKKRHTRSLEDYLFHDGIFIPDPIDHFDLVDRIDDIL